jgi:hypothetical protein
MIFQFPDLETFRLAVTGAQVPPEVSAAPAEVAFDATGRPSIRPANDLSPRAMLNAFNELGVKQTNDHVAENTFNVVCWPQVLPLTKTAKAPEITSTTPVLFEMPADEMRVFVTEMLRLGNDRQSYRTLAAHNGTGSRVLLKVIGPPYYTLLRAIDKATHESGTVTAYLEAAPRVWVELGYEHPMASRIAPAAGQALLLRPERNWLTIKAGPFEDVYKAIEFKLPAAPVEWHEAQLKSKLAVPLKLAPGNAADPVELWVLTANAVDQLDALVRDADERLLARLLFAVGRAGGQTTIVLRTRPSKLSPPVLAFDNALGFKPYWKLPNLFLPAGKRLTPTLRRDMVRKLLADDPAQIVWLMPHADGKFTPTTLPDDVFRPLADWVDYLIDHEHAALEAWIASTRFDFDSFICRDDLSDVPPPPADKSRKGKKGGHDDLDKPVKPLAPAKGAPKKAGPDEVTNLQVVEVAPPSELKIRLRELEATFKDIAGPLDDPSRVELWPRLARLNAALRDKSEAAICWTNTFWDMPEPSAEDTWQWLQAEDPEARRTPTAAEWDAALSVKLPSPEAVRSLVARVLYASRLRPSAASFVSRLPRIREYLERHENMLGVRAVWLTWWHLAGLGGPTTDVKAVAHVRDRLLQRLLDEGLNKERDLPVFLRVAGAEDSERSREVRSRAKRLYQLVVKWHDGKDVKINEPYVDLMFAFGMAKLGETTAARDLMNAATAKIHQSAGSNGLPHPAHEFLLKAYLWRIENALQAKPHSGPLPTDLMTRLESVDKDRSKDSSQRSIYVNSQYIPDLTVSYIVDRLREQSWILEPQSKPDPYRDSKRNATEVQKILARLPDEKDPRRIAQTIDQLVGSPMSMELRVIVFAYGVELGPRISEDFTLSLIQQVPRVLIDSFEQHSKQLPAPSFGEWHRKLLERSLFLAAHFDRAPLVKLLLDNFFVVLKSRPEEERYDAISSVSREGMRSLRKLGLKDEINRFLTQISKLIVQGKSLSQLRTAAGKRWPEVLAALLSLAEGWLYFGGVLQAQPFLDEARTTIFENGKVAKNQSIVAIKITKLIQAYVSALSQGPLQDALNRLDELFDKMERLPNTFTTSSFFSRLHLNIVEEVIRSLVSESSTLGSQARRWLDDDEYLVRRRIHADMRKLLASHGL